MAFLFSATLFVSAFLLFVIQPMAGKILLPLLGGTPEVWNSCMVFFQATLLAGYAYAHLLSLLRRRNAALFAHVVFTVVALTLALITRNREVASAAELTAVPSFWVFKTLALWLGFPLVVLSATSPLLQRWLGQTRHRAAGDPYHLYAASNAGSLAALLCYPVVIEPLSTLRTQRSAWLWGLALLALLVAASALATVARTHRPAPTRATPPPRAPLRLRAQWLALSLVPSSLLLGVTAYITTDLAPMPLLWVIPLVLYLLSYILALHVSPRRQAWLGRAVAFCGLLTLVALVNPTGYPVFFLVLLHLLFFFTASLFCHSRLMALRPHTRDLTSFYLWLALGGVAGGAFNALVAPFVFKEIVEYPAAIILACWLREGEPGADQRLSGRVLAILALILVLATRPLVLSPLTAALPWEKLRAFVLVGAPALACFLLIENRRAFVLALTCFLVPTSLVPAGGVEVLLRTRSFFGVTRVVHSPLQKATMLFHGRTLHGWQSRVPGLEHEPTSYYARSGPVADLLAPGGQRRRVAVIGLGTGTLAAYARKGEHWTFFEIDPEVIAIATTSRYFSFVRDSRASIDFRVGDARLQLEREPDTRLDLLIIDAFGSDAIPVHLLTREALALYWRKLRPGGLVAFHVSNSYLDLTKALGPLAAATGATAFVRDHSPRQGDPLAVTSTWVVMARDLKALASFVRAPQWRSLEWSRSAVAWSDDYFNITGLLKF